MLSNPRINFAFYPEDSAGREHNGLRELAALRQARKVGSAVVNPFGLRDLVI